MRISLIKGSELSLPDIERWRAIQRQNCELSSPYFCPEFTQAVAAVRGDVFVGILEKDNEVVGYFPHQRRRFGIGYPVGGALSDFHGVVAIPELKWDALALLRGCKLTSWQFHHLLASQAPFFPCNVNAGESYYLDLSKGFDAYADSLKKAGSNLTDKGRRRRLERDFKIEFVANISDPSALQTLIQWKSTQYRSTGLSDIFARRWTVELLHRIHATQSHHFAGRLSGLYFDGEPAALHMGMISETVWNWWFPRHDQRFAKHSPGIYLCLYVAEHAPTIGIKRIDLGIGDEGTYKSRFRSSGIQLAKGRAEAPSAVTSLFRWRQKIEKRVRQTPLAGIVRAPGRLIKRIEKWYEVR